MTIKTKVDVVNMILKYRYSNINKSKGIGFAPCNIALCKYWGKRNNELNLPVNASLSISLASIGTHTKISLVEKGEDQIFLNGKLIFKDTSFARRIINFLNLFRFRPNMHFSVDTSNDFKESTGLATSASGNAALVKALNDLFMWNLDKIHLSILARLGSGSACRSLWNGFVKWEKGELANGMDSFARVLPFEWQKLRIGILVLSNENKKVSSREAMLRSVLTSPFYKDWPKKSKNDITLIENAISKKDFDLFGETIESNSLGMHACIMTSNPPIIYSNAKTIDAIHRVWDLRNRGLSLYFTQDAGANLIFLFLAKNEAEIKKIFPEIRIINPFESIKS